LDCSAEQSGSVDGKSSRFRDDEEELKELPRNVGDLIVLEVPFKIAR